MKLARQFESTQTYMGRYEYGEDLIYGLETFCQENAITAAWVNIIGALSKATLSYYEQIGHKYVNKSLNGEFEIVSCSGNISLKEGKPFAHLHIVLSDTQYQCLGGHLIPGSTSVFAGEFVLHVLTGQASESPELSRCLDEKTGLALW